MFTLLSVYLDILGSRLSNAGSPSPPKKNNKVTKENNLKLNEQLLIECVTFDNYCIKYTSTFLPTFI